MSECLKLHISQVFKDEVAKNGFNHVSVAKIMKMLEEAFRGIGYGID